MTKSKILISSLLFCATLLLSAIIGGKAFADSKSVCICDGQTSSTCSGSNCTTYSSSEGEAGTTLEGCTKLPVKLAEIQTCPLCPLFEVILKTDQTMATKSYDALATSFRNVIIMVMGLYIAFQVLMTVSAFTKQDTPKFIATLLTQAFKVLVAALLLTNSSYIYNYVINPLMKAALEFGLALLFSSDALSKFQSYMSAAQSSFSSGAIGTDVLGSIIASVKLFTEAAAELPAIGSSLICVSTHSASIGGIIPHIPMFIEGLIVYAFGWAIVLTSAFYLLDSAVRFGIFCALLPFLIAAWPFKITRSYTKTGWDIFMNSVFNFIMIGLVISVNSELVSEALGGSKDEIMEAFNGDNVDKLKELMSISGVQFLILIACCMFAFKIVGQINALASEISSTSGGESIGGKIGGAAAQAVKGAAGMAAKGGKAVGKFASDATGLTASINAKKAKVANRLGKMGAKVGLGAQANPNGAGGAGGGDDDAGGGDGNSGDDGNNNDEGEE